MSIKYKRPLTQPKKFGKVIYYYQGTLPNKRLAKFSCQKFRLNGYNARFIKEPYGGYSVYIIRKTKEVF